ncbi:hypothetical protein [Heyndrickxia camelliae]|uniref:Uncharacterized protein n=1 Tax=Heyndrickxia camelliae TaxID=1707093 RepID=A0A2N3LG50_9BACI|nr:hypothetical protein [Heyndrickxia camelliae]PKR83610.1 hypothetical protein CWO92_18785 [Heyndrickxia camelliae]
MNKNYFIAGTIFCMIMCILSLFVFINPPLFIIFLILMITSIAMTNIIVSKTEKKNIENDIQKINNLINKNNLNKDQFFMNLDHTEAILLDQENKLLATLKNVNNDFQLTQLPFSSIIESEIIVDEVSVILGSKSGQSYRS